MPRVPQAENTVRIAGLPSARSNVNFTPEAFGAGQARGLAALGSVVTDYAEKEQQKQDTAALMAAERKLQEWQNQTLFAPETGAFSQRGQNAFGLPDKVMPDWDKQVGETEKGLTTRQQAIFRERAANMRTSMERDLFRHVGSEADAFQKEETTALVTTRLETAMLYWKDPARFDTELREAQGVFLAGNDDMPPAAQKIGLMRIESGARATVVGRMIEENPLEAQRYFDTYRDTMTEADRAATERVLKPARLDAEAEADVRAAKAGRPGAMLGQPMTFDGAVERVLADEGGYVNDPVDRGGETNFGISKRANPDVDVKNLTRDEAKKLYRDRYWTAIDADSLPEEMRAIAFDAAVNQGVGWTKAALKKANGDPVAFARLRGERYNEIVANDPSQKKFAQGWQNRLERYAQQGEAPAGPPAHADVLRSLNEIDDPERRRLALSKYRTQIEIDQLAEQERKESFVETINAKVEAAAPTGNLRTILSREEYAWAAEQGKLPAWEARLNQRLAGTEPKTDPNLFDALQTVLARAENGDATAIAEVRKMDVTKLYTSLDRQARDYVQNRRQGLIAALGKSAADKSQDFASEDQLLNVEVFDKLGISKNPEKKESEADKQTRLQFMQTYWATTQAKQTELGRKLNSGEQQQIMRDLLLPFSKEVQRTMWFDTTETKRGFEIGRVPQVDRQQIVAAYRQLYKTEPTDEQVSAAYLRGQGFAPQMETE